MTILTYVFTYQLIHVYQKSYSSMAIIASRLQCSVNHVFWLYHVCCYSMFFDNSFYCSLYSTSLEWIELNARKFHLYAVIKVF